jgi:predicted GH43/DUF377 family glycosyl hydrolase
MLYRAAGHDDDHVITLGLATSKDGYHFERASDQPAMLPSEDGFDGGCVEDPRIVKMGGWYYVTYACRPFVPGQYWVPGNLLGRLNAEAEDDWPWTLRTNATSTGLGLTKDFKTWIRAGRLTSPTVDNRDVILFPEKVNGKYVMLHRPLGWVGEKYGTGLPGMWISFSEDLLEWPEHKLLAKCEFDWEFTKIGGNTPPIKTEHGWLLIYHAVGQDMHYRLGAMLLDLNDPSIILKRTKDWLMQPEEPWELEGHYNGCVFPCGKVVIDDTLFVYYGGGDRYCGLATCSFSGLIDYLLSS